MPVRRGTMAVAAALLVMAATTSARAVAPVRDFASSGTAIVSADQLMPIVSYISTTTTNSDGSKTTNSATSVSLVTASAGNTAAAISFKMLPRLAFDYVVGPGVTIGASAWIFANLSVSQNITPAAGGAATSTDQPKGTYWGFAPRIGYVLPVGDIVALWPRVGVEYGDLEIGGVTRNGMITNGGSVNQLALDLEGLLVVTPFEHFGFGIGPIGAIPLTGKVNTTATVAGVGVTTSNDIAMWYAALTLNIFGYF